MVYQWGKEKVRQGKWDVRRVYKSKAEYMESLGIEIDSNTYTTHKEEMDNLVEVQIYWKKFYIDKEGCLRFLWINWLEDKKVEESWKEEEMSLCIKALEEENKQYKEAINWYREKVERAEEKVADAKMIYWNKIWRFLQKRFHLIDDEYEAMMKFLDD